MITHLVQPNSSGKIKFLTLTLVGNTITKEYGLIGGKVQTRTSTYKAKNVGKSNEVSAENAAMNEMLKVISKKKKEQYQEAKSLNTEDIPAFNDPFDFDLDEIPTGFCCSKPITKITEEEINAVLATGSAKAFVKYNGGCHYIHINSKEEVKISTRRWDDHTTKYPDIVEAVKAYEFPANTLLIVELCIDPSKNLPHMEAFNLFTSISKSNTKDGKCKDSQEKALALQKENKVRVVVYGILYYGGEQVWHKPYKEIWEKIDNVFPPLSSGSTLFKPQEILRITSGKALIDLAITHKTLIEGFMLWNTEKALEVTMNGKPKRRASWKIKARGEMDVIAVAGIEGKVAGHYGSISIGRYDNNYEFVSMGEVSGLKDAETIPSTWNFPCVIEVTYDNIFPETGKLQFGNFSKVHEDKIVKEVDLFSLV